jgi:hypothetical protein
VLGSLQPGRRCPQPHVTVYPVQGMTVCLPGAAARNDSVLRAMALTGLVTAVGGVIGSCCIMWVTFHVWSMFMVGLCRVEALPGRHCWHLCICMHAQ